VHGEDQHRGLRGLLLDLAGHLQPGQLRHSHVEDRQVGPLPGRQVPSLGSVGGLGDHVDVGLPLEQQPQPGADYPVVVGDQDSHHIHQPDASAASPPPLATIITASIVNP
jgi:hypothetical protein